MTEGQPAGTGWRAQAADPKRSTALKALIQKGTSRGRDLSFHLTGFFGTSSCSMRAIVGNTAPPPIAQGRVLYLALDFTGALRAEGFLEGMGRSKKRKTSADPREGLFRS